MLRKGDLRKVTTVVAKILGENSKKLSEMLDYILER